MGVDTRTKKQKVSRKECLPKPEGWVERPPRKRDDNRSNDRCAPRRDDRKRDERPSSDSNESKSEE